MSTLPREFLRTLVADLACIPLACVQWTSAPQMHAYPRNDTIYNHIDLSINTQDMRVYSPEYRETYNPTGGDDGEGVIEVTQKTTYITSVRIACYGIALEDAEWASDTLMRLRFRLEHIAPKAALRTYGIVLVEQGNIVSQDDTVDGRAMTVASYDIRLRHANVATQHLRCGEPTDGGDVTDTFGWIERVEDTVATE